MIAPGARGFAEWTCAVDIAIRQKYFFRFIKKLLLRLLCQISIRQQFFKNVLRNSNVMAIAPTATISTIIGVTQSIEPNPIPNQADGTVDIEYKLVERATDQLEVSGGYGGGMLVGTIGCGGPRDIPPSTEGDPTEEVLAAEEEQVDEEDVSESDPLGF